MASSEIHKVIVIGSTGATGKYVVNMLLDRGDTKVVAVARSKKKLIGLLSRKDDENRKLIVKEASIIDVTVNELRELVEGSTAIVW